MNPAAKIAFDDTGSRILAVPFAYPGDDPDESASEESSRALAAMEAVQHGLLIVIRDGHADAAIVRAGALARLCGLFASDAAAAAAVRVNRSTMSRAVRRLRHEIVRAAQHKKLAASPMK